MQIAQVNVFEDPQRRSPEALLLAWPALVDIAEAPLAAGLRVAVLQASHHDARLAVGGVDYHFVRGGAPALARRAAQLDPAVLHIHGLSFSRPIRQLARALPQLPLLLQDHADRLPRWWRRPAWKRALAGASGVAFCSVEQAAPFVQAGLLRSDVRIFEIPESTSRFRPGDRDQARAASGLHGDPGVLWVGHLDANKDPLTVLDGIGRAAQRCPGLQLWCCYGSTPLLPAVRARIAADPRLAGRVHLLGTVPHAQIETLLRAADLFVLGSHREGSGFALIEALACGLPPVVTDIPSFRALTGNGAVGQLWRCGDEAQLAAALVAQWRGMNDATRTAVREHFERRLSVSAIGRAFSNAYEELSRSHGRVGT